MKKSRQFSAMIFVFQLQLKSKFISHKIQAREFSISKQQTERRNDNRISFIDPWRYRSAYKAHSIFFVFDFHNKNLAKPLSRTINFRSEGGGGREIYAASFNSETINFNDKVNQQNLNRFDSNFVIIFARFDGCCLIDACVPQQLIRYQMMSIVSQDSR